MSATSYIVQEENGVSRLRLEQTFGFLRLEGAADNDSEILHSPHGQILGSQTGKIGVA